MEGAETGSAQGLRDENKNGLVFVKMLERSLLGRALRTHPGLNGNASLDDFSFFLAGVTQRALDTSS